MISAMQKYNIFNPACINPTNTSHYLPLQIKSLQNALTLTNTCVKKKLKNQVFIITNTFICGSHPIFGTRNKSTNQNS